MILAGALLGAALAAPDASSSPDLVYFALVDRFSDGDPGNNGAIDLADPQAFHGGDLQGVRQRLDYLQSLGVSTIWLSPVFEMQTEKFHGHGAFHGYWVRDMTRIEPRFGGEAALRALAADMKARGMKLVLDVVYNHVGWDSPLLAEEPGWFHPPAPITDWNDPLQLVSGQVHGLPDLAQEEDEVYHYLLGRTLYWARELDLAGLRIDAVRHLPRSFLRQVGEDLRERVGSDLWLLGEDFHGDALALSESFRGGGFDAMFDFPLRYAMVDTFCEGRHAGRLAATLSLDRLYDDPHGLVTFLDNHDLPRILTECHGERWRVELALAFQFAVRGVPALTYGTEIPLEGAGEPENRADMRWGAPGPLAPLIASLQALRRDHPSLTRGTTRILSVSEGFLILSRIAPEEGAVIAFNLGELPILAHALYGSPTTSAALVPGQPLRAIDGPTTEIPPRGAAISFYEPHSPAHPLWPAPDAPAAVAVAAAGEGLRIVGAGPELGNWDPAEGVVLAGGRAALPARPGEVLEWKLVRQAADGSFQWEEGENRYLLVPDEPARLEVAWQKPARLLTNP